MNFLCYFVFQISLVNHTLYSLYNNTELGISQRKKVVTIIFDLQGMKF